MNLEEELRRSVDQLADHLRDELGRRLEAIASDLQTTVQAERKAAGAEAARIAKETAEREAGERLTDAVAEAEARAHDAGLAEGRAAGLEDGRAEGREAGLADGRAEGRQQGLAEGRAQGLEEARRQTSRNGKDSLERLVGALREIDGARSLSEVLNVLTRTASREAARVAVLLVRGEHLESWKFSGFGAALDAASQFAMPLTDGGLIAEAVRGAAAVSADSTDETSQPGFASLPSGRTMVAVPLTMSGQVVAVLYSDQDEVIDPGTVWPTTLELLARYAARSLEALTAFRAAKLLAGWEALRPSPRRTPETGRPERAIIEAAGDGQSAHPELLRGTSGTEN
jgi:hypothetical protein